MTEPAELSNDTAAPEPIEETFAKAHQAMERFTVATIEAIATISAQRDSDGPD